MLEKLKRAVGGGYHEGLTRCLDALCLKMHRDEDAKRQSLLRFELFKKIDKFLSLNLRNILISPLEGEKKFLSELCELSNKGRLGILAQHEAGFEPSLLSGEGIDSVISSDFKSKILVNNENILPRKELSALVPQYLSNFFDVNHSQLTSHFSHKRTAFTLAEVLITLGIIGIVAALTLPSLIHNYKIKQLKTAFLKSSSVIQNALNNTANEYGIDNIYDFNSICNAVSVSETGNCRNGNAEQFKEISDTFISNFVVVKKVQVPYPKYVALNYNGKAKFGYANLYGITTFNTPNAGAYLLQDGSLVSAISFFYHNSADGLSLTFDTNGPDKGPNRLGYDIFIYNTGFWNKLCAIEKMQPYTSGLDTIFNGRGCYTYALKDVNPDDSSKGYWKSLK